MEAAEQTVPVQSGTDYVFTDAVYYPEGSTGTVTALLDFDGRTPKLLTDGATGGRVTKETRFNSGTATSTPIDIHADDAHSGPVYFDDFFLARLWKPFTCDGWASALGVDATFDDDDGDDRSSMDECIFDRDPTNPADRGMGSFLVLEGDVLKLSYRQQNDDQNLHTSTEVCTDLVDGPWAFGDYVPVVVATTGTYSNIKETVPSDAPQSFFRHKAVARPRNYLNGGCYEIVPSGTSDDTDLIQDALDQLQAGDTLKLKGYFFIADTIYLPSNFKWVLNGTLTLADNADDDLDRVGWYEELNDANNNIIDARARTGITEQPGGAVNIEMSGGTYSGNSAGNPASLRFINFVSVTNSLFHDMVITDVSDDNFTLGPGSNGNVCSNLVGSFSVSGNGLTDKGDHNTWYDCIAEDCTGPDGDGWTPKCRFSQFYRCISRRNGGPGFGMYCRTDGSGNPDDIGEAIDGNRFYECVAYENGGAGFSFNISGNSGAGATIRSNFVQAVCFSNESSGVRFRNTTVDGIVADNRVDLLCYHNQSQKTDGSLSSTAGGLGTDAGAASPPITGLTGSMVSFDNVQWDVNTRQAYKTDLAVYHPAGEHAPILQRGDSSNILTLEQFDCADPLTAWSMKAYCNQFRRPR